MCLRYEQKGAHSKAALSRKHLLTADRCNAWDFDEAAELPNIPHCRSRDLYENREINRQADSHPFTHQAVLY
jgi:hypothetical protein